MTTLSHDIACRFDYFTHVPTGRYDHFSLETPLCSPTLEPGCETPSDPYHPLLADRSPENTATIYPNMSANLLQLQTRAAHGTHISTRPSARPTQNVLHVTSDDDSSSSDSSESITSPPVSSSPCEYARCSRCQRTPSIDIRTGQWNMIQYGLNLWYCVRCAGLVGFSQR